MPFFKKQKQSKNELYDAFILFDTNQDGRITEGELHLMLKFLGIKASDNEVKLMISKADVDGNGTVEYDEFIRMMERYASVCENQPDSEMSDAFKVFDRNNDSFIDSEELKRTMHSLGVAVTDEEVNAMIVEADTDRDGLINFEEFKKMMLLLQKPSKRKPTKLHSRNT